MYDPDVAILFFTSGKLVCTSAVNKHTFKEKATVKKV
ncbi:MAG: hypothetical protein JTT13_04860 [Candidatus Brockarchaeota archaeon]|nr:hypothetical protein [Candidatus Brockarchaeota archaeon]